MTDEKPGLWPWPWIAGGAVLALVLGVIFWRDVRILMGQSADLARRTGAPIPVRAEPARLELLADTIGANAVVEPLNYVKVPARVTGVVQKVFVDVGQQVKAGDVLAELEPLIPEAVQSAAVAEQAQARASMEIARSQYARVESLHAEKILSDVELENARLQLVAAEARYQSAQTTLQRAKLDVSLGTKIISPIAGVVQERYVNAGEAIREDRQDFFKVGSIDQIAAVAKVAEEKTPSVRLGQAAEVIFDAFPNQLFAGEVVKIDPTIDPQTRTFKVYVKVANPELRIKPGLSAYVRLKFQMFALTVPRLAVMSNGGQASVFVVEGDRARLRGIKIQPATFGRVAVTDGLKEGEQVVYYKLIKLEDNDQVKVEAAPPAVGQAPTGAPSPVAPAGKP